MKSGIGGLLRWGIFPLAAVGVILSLALLNRGEVWTLVRASGSNRISIDDRIVDLSEGDVLNQSLRGAHHLGTDDSTVVVIRLGSRVLLEIDASTRVTNPNTPGRFVDTDLNLSLAEGAVRIVTGPDFSGRLRLFTPEARAEVRGAALAAVRHADGSELFVYEGSLEIGSGDKGGSMDVMAGSGARVSGPGSVAVAIPLPPAERARLARLRGEAFRGP